MNISDAQTKVYNFHKQRSSELGADLTSELAFLHLTEEIGEIARQLINKQYPNFRKYDDANLKEEVVQALMDLLLLSKILEISLPEEIDKKIEEMRNRRSENPSP